MDTNSISDLETIEKESESRQTLSDVEGHDGMRFGRLSMT